MTPEQWHNLLLNPGEKYFKPLPECFKPSGSVTDFEMLFHVYRAYIDELLPKWIFYLTLRQVFGEPNGKTDNGRQGYYLKLSI